jgi:hypothetical protein
VITLTYKSNSFNGPNLNAVYAQYVIHGRSKMMVNLQCQALYILSFVKAENVIAMQWDSSCACSIQIALRATA